MYLGSSDEDSESSDVETTAETTNVVQNAADAGFFDSDESEENRVVLGAEERFNLDLETLVFSMQNSADKFEFADAWDRLQEVGKLFKKNKTKRRNFKEPIPKFWLIQMNRFLENLKKTKDEEKQKLKKLQKKHSKMWQRFKTKVIKGTDYPHEKEVAKYAETHDIWGEDEAEIEEEEMDADEVEEESMEQIKSGGDEDEDVDEDDIIGEDDFGDDDFNSEDFEFEVEDLSGDERSSGDEDDYDSRDMFDRRFWMKEEYLKKEAGDDSDKSDAGAISDDENAPEFWGEFDRHTREEIYDKVTSAHKKKEKEVRRTLIDEYEMSKEEALQVWNWLRKPKKQAIEKKPVGKPQEIKWDEKRVRKSIEAVLESNNQSDRSERKKHIKLLKEVDTHVQRPQWKILTKLLLINNLLDQYTPPRHLKAGAFNDVLTFTSDLVGLLEEYPKYRLHILGLQQLELSRDEKDALKKVQLEMDAQTRFEAGLAQAEGLLKENDVVEEEEVEGLDSNYYWLAGNLVAYCDRLHNDLRMSLKKMDSKTVEYRSRLEDTDRLVALCEKCLAYSRDVIEHKMRTLQFTHFIVKLTYEAYIPEWDILGEETRAYKPFDLPHDTKTLKNAHSTFKMLKEFDPEKFGADPENENQMAEYAEYAKKIKEESVLFTVHHLARHHRYLLARDILKASGISKAESVTSSDVLVQILYNRTVARLAIAAFAREEYLIAMTTLQKLYITGKIKELLAQGVQKEIRWKHHKTPEEVAAMQQEELRMVPDHNFIQSDLLESVYYISALLFMVREILLQSQDDNHVHKNYSFRTFRGQWDKRQKREFLAPPENDREAILEAGARMMVGDWQACLKYLEDLKCWEHFDAYAEVVKNQVRRKAQAECLRCYLISSSKHFFNIKLEVLADKFELEEPVIIKLCSQFILANDFRGSIDEPGGFLVVHEHLRTQFEIAAFQFQKQVGQFLSSIQEVGESLNIRQQGNGQRERYRQNTRKEGRSEKKVWRS